MPIPFAHVRSADSGALGRGLCEITKWCQVMLSRAAGWIEVVQLFCRGELDGDRKVLDL